MWRHFDAMVTQNYKANLATNIYFFIGQVQSQDLNRFFFFNGSLKRRCHAIEYWRDYLIALFLIFYLLQVRRTGMIGQALKKEIKFINERLSLKNPGRSSTKRLNLISSLCTHPNNSSIFTVGCGWFAVSYATKN